MAGESLGRAALDGSHVARLVAQGTAGHPLPARLMLPIAVRPLRDLADAVHHVCLLYGRHPGVIENAAGHTAIPAARAWLEAAVDGFARERTCLTRLVVAAGPLPSTPGHAETEAAVMAQRHALDMLSQSDRVGCALGAALALVVDWPAVRRVLDAAGDAFGVLRSPPILPDAAATAALAASIAQTPAAERALLFGADQLLAQQRGLWDLLAARAEARDPA